MAGSVKPSSEKNNILGWASTHKQTAFYLGLAASASFVSLISGVVKAVTGQGSDERTVSTFIGAIGYAASAVLSSFDCQKTAALSAVVATGAAGAYAVTSDADKLALKTYLVHRTLGSWPTKQQALEQLLAYMEKDIESTNKALGRMADPIAKKASGYIDGSVEEKMLSAIRKVGEALSDMGAALLSQQSKNSFSNTSQVPVRQVEINQLVQIL